MKNKIFFTIIFFIHVHVNALSLYPMNQDEIDKAKEKMAYFYAQELVSTGVFLTEDEAFFDAQQEVAYDDGSKHCFVFIMNDASKPIGYLVYDVQEDNKAYIQGIFLDPASRGCGYGYQILLDLEVELKNLGISEIKLYVFAHNMVAQKLYQKLEYKVCNTYENNNGAVIGFHMIKSL